MAPVACSRVPSERDRDALAAFQAALKNAPEYVPALEGAAQIEAGQVDDAVD